MPAWECSYPEQPRPLTWSYFDPRYDAESLPPTGWIQSVSSHMLPVLTVTTLLLLLHAALFTSSKNDAIFAPKVVSLLRADRHKFIMDIISIGNSVIMTSAFVATMVTLSADAMTRLGERNFFSNFGMTWIEGVTVYETLIYVASVDFRGAVWAHHIVVMYFIGLCLTTGQLHFYQAWGGIVEGTNVFLCTLTIRKRLGIDVGVFVGVGFWASFLLLRVLSLPALMYTLTQDYELELEHIMTFVPQWRCGCLGGASFIWVLSCFWFYSLTKGMLKILRGKDEKKGKDQSGKDKKKGN